MSYRFAQFTLDIDRIELIKAGTPVEIEPKAYDVLRVLVEARDRVVTKDELFERVWPGVFVSEASISAAIKQVRGVLGDDGVSQRFVRTIRGKGFRFVAETEASSKSAAAPSAPNAPLDQPVGATQGGPPVIVVLPFHALASDGSQAAIAEALPAEMIGALSRLRGYKVLARASTFQFDPALPDLAALHARLGADYVVTGSVEQIGGRLSVQAELTDVAAKRVLWSESYSSRLDEVFEIRQSIVRAICNVVEMQVPLAEADRLSHVPTENLDSWGHFHIGMRHLMWFRGTHHDIAAWHFDEAMRLDPGFARAHSARGYVELEGHNLVQGGDRERQKARGLELAETALDLDPLDPFCNLVLSRAHWASRDLDAATALAARAVQLNTNYAQGHYELGKFMALACMGGEADEHAASALSLSPLDPMVAAMISARALAAFVRGDTAAALAHADASLRAPNAHVFVHAIAAAVYAANGREAAAQRAVSRIGNWNSGLSMRHILHLFSLRDPERHSEMVAAFERLGLR